MAGSRGMIVSCFGRSVLTTILLFVTLVHCLLGSCAHIIASNYWTKCTIMYFSVPLSVYKITKETNNVFTALQNAK